jgi:hypothetical protein
LTGSSAAQALLDVSGSAGFGTAGVLSGHVRLAGDSAIEFASGEITSLAAHASLVLNGSDAFIEDGSTGSNSALTGLASIGAGAVLGLNNNSAVSTTGALVNDGDIGLDLLVGDGGSSLTLAGALTNSGSLRIGNVILSASDKVTTATLDNTGSINLTGSSASQALLDATAGGAGFGTAGVLSGNVSLGGNSAIEFASGEITSLAANAQLHLNGNDAFIEDSTALGSNSALTGLASISSGATFELESASVSTTGALVNDGNVHLDANAGDGGSSLTLTGALTNSRDLTVGNKTLSASDDVTAASLDNKGSIVLTGSGANQALLDVTGSAGFGTAGVVTGNVQLSGDSAIEFASGEITSVANGSQLTLNGNDALVEDSTALGSNSALSGLATIGAGAAFTLLNGASASITGALVNNSLLYLDNTRPNENGGSSLSVAGALTNSFIVSIGNGIQSAPDTLTAASLSNTNTLNGGVTNQALLDVTTGTAGFGTAGVLSGYVQIGGEGVIEFASGQINTIAASAGLYLGGENAFIEDSSALNSNSALTGLSNISGFLTLEGNPSNPDIVGGASVSTTGALTNDGTINLDTNGRDGGSSLSVAGALTNTGALNIGDSGLSSSDSVTAKSFVNSGTVDLTGSGANLAALNVSGATTNNRSISIASDTEELAGAVGGAGSFSLNSAILHFDSSVSAGQTINESGADALILDKAQSFDATISAFGKGDTIDATNFLAPPATTFNFVENSGGTGGTLTLHDGSLTANILMMGKDSNSDFTLAPDSGTGTLVKFL